MKLIFLELNELNFEYLNYYISKGLLPNWNNFIKNYGIHDTYSESKYENIEPWIQWPTIRTGQAYADHQIFRLGDIQDSSCLQHWEILEQNGYSVAAISPINAANRTLKSSVWLPDPWVDTPISGSSFLRKFHSAIKQAVNDNSSEKLSVSTCYILFLSLIRCINFKNYIFYFKNLFSALILKRHWSKTLILDRILFDIFFKYWLIYKFDFSVLFLNGCAHIQHHYMLNSPAYLGCNKNPSWYIPSRCDPLFEVFQLYDHILAELLSIKDVRIIVATGLTQVPYDSPVFYWRLRNHEKFLQLLGIKFNSVLPRMTRDFLITFDSEDDAILAQVLFENITHVGSGEKLFQQVDNRGLSLFITLTYDKVIDKNFKVSTNGMILSNFLNHVVFVAIKNAHHSSKGYYLDTNPDRIVFANKKLNIKELFNIVLNHFNL